MEPVIDFTLPFDNFFKEIGYDVYFHVLCCSNDGCLQGLFYVRERRLFAVAICERNNTFGLPFGENYRMGWRNRHAILGKYYSVIIVYKGCKKSNLVIFLGKKLFRNFLGRSKNCWMIFGDQKSNFVIFVPKSNL